MRESFKFGSSVITYELISSSRKTLGITVTPEMEVLVKYPSKANLEAVREKLRLKGPWIIKQQRYFQSFHPKAINPRFVSGESHLYLGRQYRLKVTLGQEEKVKLRSGFLEVYVSDRSQVEVILKKWYLENAKIKFHAIAQPLIERFSKYKVTPESLVIRTMKTRWGSCTPKGKILLNPELIKAPRACIEYVIIHELCHLVHHDHTQKFFRLQSKEMPDWEKWKNKLEKLMA